MKKIIYVLLIALALTSCSKANEETKITQNNEKEVQTKEKETQEYIEETEKETKELANEEVSNKILNDKGYIELDKKKLYKDLFSYIDNNIHNFEEGFEIVDEDYKKTIYDISGGGQIRYVLFEKNNNIEAISYIVGKKPANNVWSDMVVSAIANFWKDYIFEDINKEGKDIFNDVMRGNEAEYENLVFHPIDDNNFLHFVIFPKRLKENQKIYSEDTKISKDLFETKEDYNKIVELTREVKFNEIYSLAKNYLEKNEINNNNSKKILNIFKEFPRFEALQDKVEITKDDIEGGLTINYKGVKSFDDNVNLIPQIDVGDFSSGSFRTKAGFRNSDWIFFDYIIISNGDKDKVELSYSDNDINRDVIDGGIEEYTELSDEDKVYKLFNDNKDLTMRFRSTEKKKDVKLTEKEIQAYNILYQINKLQRKLSDEVLFPIKLDYYDEEEL